MEDFGNALSLSASGMKAQAQRLRYVSENISNADTPGYRRKLTSFEEVSTDPLTGETVEVPAKAVPFFKSGKELRERLNASGDA